jgi:hypothetical protein
MIKRKSSFAIICSSVIAVAVLIRCTQSPPVAGGASDTEVSAQVSGTVTDMFGDPVAGAAVELRLKDYLPEDDIAEIQNGLNTRADGSTDSEGFFLFDSIETGTYTLSITSGDSVGTVLKCIVEKETPVTLDPVVRPYGMVTGWIEVPYEVGALYTHARVALIGSDKMVRPDSTGYFLFPLPQGNHRLRFSVDSSFFDQLTIDVDVFPSQVKNIGVIRLNMLPPPPPPCNDPACDSSVLRQFLDEAGHADVAIGEVSTWVNGRIDILNLRGLAISIPLVPLGLLNTVRKIDLGNTGTADSCRFIISMWNLQEVYLDSNAITGISRAFEGAYRIKVLDLSDNLLTTLPDKINILIPDQELDLSGNELCALPPPLAEWADWWDPGWRATQRCP